MFLSVYFLLLASSGAAATLIAVLRERRSPLGVYYFLGCFFVAWPISELPLHHILLSALVSAVCLHFGVAEYWPGQAGLVLVVASWPFLLWLHWRGRHAQAVVENALQEGLGANFAEHIDPRFSATLKTGAPFSSWANPVKLRNRNRVERIRDLSYGPAGVRNQLDVYRPRGGAKGCPVLLQIHGGAWTYGDKNTQGLPIMNEMVQQGWVCVAPNYRLSPRATWPEHLIDCKLVMKWIRENIADYGGDPEFVAVTGGSAGGQLATLLALTPNDPKFQPGFEQVDTRVVAAVPMYALYDLLAFNSIRFETREQAGFIGTKVMKVDPVEGRAEWLSASPIHYPLEGAPPFCVFHGSHDELVFIEGCRKFVAALRQASKQPVVYAEMYGARHAFDVFASRRCVNAVNGTAAFLAWVRSNYHAGG